MKTKNFRKKISLACGKDDLRPIMQHISFDGGYAIATDAHLLLKQSLKEHGFTEDEIEIMNGKFLHAEAFNEIFRYDMVTVSEQGFTCRKGTVKCLIDFSDIGEGSKYPDWRNVIPSSTTDASLDEIGINVSLIKRVHQMTLSHTKSMRFRFVAKNKGILITPVDSGDFVDDAELILITPVMLN